MDIHLRDGNCFNIFEKVKVRTPIIFTTAYDEYAIKAFDVNSIAYILKPLNENKIRKAIEKFYLTNSFNSDQSKIEKLISIINTEHQYKSRIIIKLGENIFVIEEKDIAYFIAQGRDCYLYTKDNNKYIVDFSEYREVALLALQLLKISQNIIREDYLFLFHLNLRKILLLVRRGFQNL